MLTLKRNQHSALLGREGGSTFWSPSHVPLGHDVVELVTHLIHSKLWSMLEESAISSLTVAFHSIDSSVTGCQSLWRISWFIISSMRLRGLPPLTVSSEAVMQANVRDLELQGTMADYWDMWLFLWCSAAVRYKLADCFGSPFKIKLICWAQPTPPQIAFVCSTENC